MEGDNISSFDDSDGTSIWIDKEDFKDNTFFILGLIYSCGGTPGQSKFADPYYKQTK
jgi:hypothetical protein